MYCVVNLAANSGYGDWAPRSLIEGCLLVCALGVNWNYVGRAVSFLAKREGKGGAIGLLVLCFRGPISIKRFFCEWLIRYRLGYIQHKHINQPLQLR